uniref:Uncharacterized protein n=1 Tax=Rhizophora mucronata TaxID=61149 RepID=A0A2P2QW52_RHIMU
MLFFFQHHDLIADVIRSTYMSKSLFQPAKHSLFSAWNSKESLSSSRGPNL